MLQANSLSIPIPSAPCAECECGHSWDQHHRTANGAYACAHFGCGCRDVVIPDSTNVDPAPQPPAPTVFYLPEIHSETGSYFPELRSSDTTKATIVADIASAQHDDVRRVIEVDLAAGTSKDVSKEIAQAVLDVILMDYSRVPAWCRDFLEDQLGVGWVARAEMWEAA